MPGLNEQIAQQAMMSEDWRHHKSAKQAYEMYQRLNKALFKNKLPQAVIGFTEMLDAVKANIPRDVRYHYDGDDISLFHHIDIRQEIEGVRLLMALLKGMVHVSQESYSDKSSWYYSTKFREEIQGFGVIIDNYGDWVSFTSAFRETAKYASGDKTPTMASDLSITDKVWITAATKTYLTEIEFTESITSKLEELEKAWPQLSSEDLKKPKLKSLKPLESKPKGTKGKMKKWSCGCSIIRAAKPVSLLCMNCGAELKQEEVSEG